MRILYEDALVGLWLYLCRNPQWNFNRNPNDPIVDTGKINKIHPGSVYWIGAPFLAFWRFDTPWWVLNSTAVKLYATHYFCWWQVKLCNCLRTKRKQRSSPQLREPSFFNMSAIIILTTLVMNIFSPSRMGKTKSTSQWDAKFAFFPLH